MRTFRALVLVLLISTCAYADGNIPNDKDGNIPNDRIGEIHNPKADTATNILISLIQSMLPLL
jgi:hypothetical protein